MTVLAEPAASRACQRCGNFAPLKRVWSHDVCEACSPRVAPSGVFDKLGALLATSLRLVPSVGLVCMGSSLVLAMPFALAAAFQVENSAAYWALQAGYAAGSTCGEGVSSIVIRDFVQTGQFDVRAAVAEALRRAGTLAVLGVLYNFGLLLSITCLVLPSLWYIGSFAIATQVAVFERVGPLKAGVGSFRLMRGMRLPAILVFGPVLALQVALSLAFKQKLPWFASLSGVIWALLSYIVCTVLYLEQRSWQQR
jgi:hypothetical protein